jgi:hypothetical protein
MRLLLIPVLCGAFAGFMYAQGYRGGGGHGRGPSHAPVVRNNIGAAQLPPGTAINGVPGLQNSATLNGLPPFSNRYYNFGCYNCGSQRRARSRTPFVGFAPLFDGYSFPSSYSEEDMGPPPPLMPDPAAMALTDEVDKLRGDINQLRDQTQAQMAPPTPAPAAAPVPAEPPPPATVLVLRSGKQVETTNYAVMDQTLWNFSARPVQKIPLTSIDLQASEKANSDRGVDFSLSADSDN